MDPKIQSLDEFLGERGLSSPVSDFLLDKVRFPHGLTQRQRKAFEEEAAEAERQYAAQRKAAVGEYNRLLAEEKMRPPSDVERLLKTARGHEDNAATHAARRALEKRGIDWRTEIKPKSEENNVRFALVSVDCETDGMVDGTWMQDFTGTLEEATRWARETEQANSNRISVAVVEDMYYTPFSNVYGARRLDKVQELEKNEGKKLSLDERIKTASSPECKGEQWTKHNISYERGGVYQSILVKAPSVDAAGCYFTLLNPDATICSISKATKDDERPGKPELTAKLFEVWKDCELGQTYKEKSFLTAQEADEWIAENERCYPGWHLRVVTVEEKKLSLEARIQAASQRAENDRKGPAENAKSFEARDNRQRIGGLL